MNRLVAVAALLCLARPVIAEPPPTFIANYYTPGFNQVSQMALGPDGRVYLADAYHNRLVMLNQDGSAAGTFGGGGSAFGLPSGVVFDAAGNLYVAEQSKGRISKFAPGLTPVGTMGSIGSGPGQLNYPSNLALSPDQSKLYVTDFLNDRIAIFDPAGSFIANFGSSGTAPGQFDHPWGIAVNTAGEVFVADQLNNRIQRFDANGNYLGEWGTPGDGPGQFHFVVGLSFDDAGNLYAADQLNNRVQKFDSAGTYLTEWGSFGSADGKFYNPWCVLPLPGMRVWVGDTYNYRVSAFQTLATPTAVRSWGSMKADYR
jgi:DNA-binding beta-propeller fold protein YncE